jgi:hypothetical protein
MLAWDISRPGRIRRWVTGDARQPIGAIGSTRHVGATEHFGTELRALRDVEVSPELISDIETELRWGLVWHEFERSMQTMIDRTFAPYQAMVDDCSDFDQLRELVGIPVAA